MNVVLNPKFDNCFPCSLPCIYNKWEPKLPSVKKLQKNHKLPHSYLVILIYKWKHIFGWTVSLKSHFGFWCWSSLLVTADFEDDVIDKCKPTPAALALFSAPQQFLPKTTWFSLWPPHPNDLAVRSQSTSEAFWCRFHTRGSLTKRNYGIRRCWMWAIYSILTIMEFMLMGILCEGDGWECSLYCPKCGFTNSSAGTT